MCFMPKQHGSSELFQSVRRRDFGDKEKPAARYNVCMATSFDTSVRTLAVKNDHIAAHWPVAPAPPIANNL